MRRVEPKEAGIKDMLRGKEENGVQREVSLSRKFIWGRLKG